MIPLGDFTTNRRQLAKLSSLAVVVGVMGGLVAFLLLRLIGLITHLAYDGTWQTSLVAPSITRLGWWSVLIPVIGGVAVGAALLGYALTLGVVPACLGAFRDYQYEIRNQIAAFLLEPGVFTPVTGQITVYVQARGPDDSLRGILIEDGRDPNAPATILARTGRLIVNRDGPVVELENGSREQIDPKTGQLDVLSFKSNILSLAQPAKLGGRDYVDASEASLPALLHPSPELRPDERGKWLVEAQRRLTAPLSTLSYTLVGLVAVLGGAFRRYGGILRPAAAVAVVTVLVALGLGVSNLAARDVRLLPLIWAVTLLPGLWAAYLLARQGAPRA